MKIIRNSTNVSAIFPATNTVGQGTGALGFIIQPVHRNEPPLL